MKKVIVFFILLAATMPLKLVAQVNPQKGYIITNDPAYISSYKGARTLIQTVERDEILKELVRSYLKQE